MKYLLRTRDADELPWSAPIEFPTRRARDKEALVLRCVFGTRVWRIDESSRERHKAGDQQPAETQEGGQR